MTATPSIRCAIYTRKSSDEGLEQDFNSLDAQHEACAAYIASQRHEGWKPVATRYDDGGISGGTLERPALQRLLADIDAGRIGMVVVYKIDRLTRSLADFAKLVDRLEAAGASFVSVTQAFNTSTSMGRLTLNVLLSFAQFEREVTAERIRDKIAASKKKGLWMGGTLPLGYDRHPDPLRRELVVNDAEAETVRTLFRLYNEVGNLRIVEAEAKARGLRSKTLIFSTGRTRGGGSFGRSQLHYLLRNPVYHGMIRHRHLAWPGQHAAIIDEELWTRVQKKLRDASERSRHDEVAVNADGGRAVLLGKLRDETGDRLTPTHCRKNGRRYRYYVSHRMVRGTADPLGWRLPAAELEGLVADLTAAHIEGAADRQQVVAKPDARSAEPLLARCAALAAEFRRPGNSLVGALVAEGIIGKGCIDLRLDSEVLSRHLGVATAELNAELVRFTAPVQLKRRGVELRLVSGKRRPATDKTLLRALSSAHRWADQMRAGRTLAEIAAKEGKTDSTIRTRAQLAFLAPDIQARIVEGRLPPDLTLDRLLRLGLPLDWERQHLVLGL